MDMQAIELNGFEGLKSLSLTEREIPKLAPREALIEVKAAGVNYAEWELIHGKYPAPGPLPLVMGFEAAGTVAEVGSRVTSIKVGDRVTSVVSSGGYAQYAKADENLMIPVPDGLSFAEASTIPIQGLSAYALLKFAARPRPNESMLIQAAAGGVGLYLVQLAKIMGVKQVIALASSDDKLEQVKTLGADVVVNYNRKSWADQVTKATDGRGVDIVLEMASGEVGEESFKLAAPFGRIVLFGARNYHDSISTARVQQLIFQNQSVIGFAIPTLPREMIAQCVAPLMELISSRRIKIFAANTFPLARAKDALEALSSRRTVGKVVLVP